VIFRVLPFIKIALHDNKIASEDFKGACWDVSYDFSDARLQSSYRIEGFLWKTWSNLLMSSDM